MHGIDGAAFMVIIYPGIEEIKRDSHRGRPFWAKYSPATLEKEPVTYALPLYGARREAKPPLLPLVNTVMSAVDIALPTALTPDLIAPPISPLNRFPTALMDAPSV